MTCALVRLSRKTKQTSPNSLLIHSDLCSALQCSGGKWAAASAHSALTKPTVCFQHGSVCAARPPLHSRRKARNWHCSKEPRAWDHFHDSQHTLSTVNPQASSRRSKELQQPPKLLSCCRDRQGSINNSAEDYDHARKPGSCKQQVAGLTYQDNAVLPASSGQDRRKAWGPSSLPARDNDMQASKNKQCIWWTEWSFCHLIPMTSSSSTQSARQFNGRSRNAYPSASLLWSVPTQHRALCLKAQLSNDKLGAVCPNVPKEQLLLVQLSAWQIMVHWGQSAASPGPLARALLETLLRSISLSSINT